jgi:hypothetical protein
MTLLFRLAEWHALAKLRMHTESTLATLENVTTVLGRELRKFNETTCSAFKTVELESEAAARGRRRKRKAANQHANSSASNAPAVKPKPFNLSIYKFHALGDYVRTIREFGTTDSYNTQIVRVYALLLSQLIVMPSPTSSIRVSWLTG